MDEGHLASEEMVDELTKEFMFHTVYAIICLYYLKPSKNIKKHYKELPAKAREDFEKTFIEQGLFERADNTIVVTTKGVDFLLGNIISHVDATMACINTLKEINKTYDDDENEYYHDDDYAEEEDSKEENKLPDRNVRRQEKRKQKRQQNQDKN
jgi:hypothetical protein